MGWLGKDTDGEGAGEGLGRCGSGYGEGLGRCGSERAAPAGVRSPRSLSTRLLLSLGQVRPRESTCRPHLRGDPGRSYTIHGPKTPGSPSCNLEQTLRPRIQQRRQRMRQQAFSFPANFPPPQKCCSVHVLASLGTLQQNEWLPRLEKLLNIPSRPLLSVSNSDPEFFSLVRSRDQTRENVETIRRHKKRVNSEAYF